MAKNKRKKTSGHECSGEGLALAAGAAVASIAGNIVQAIDKKQLAAHLEHLRSALRQWQEAYNQLWLDYTQIQKGYERQQEELNDARQQIVSLHNTANALRKQNLVLEKELADCVKEKNHAK